MKYKTPFKIQPLIAGENLAYQVPVNVFAQIRAATFHNSSPNAQVIKVHIVPSNIEVIDDTTRILQKSLGVNESYLCPEIANHVLQVGDKVYFVGEGVNAMLSVLEQNL